MDSALKLPVGRTVCFLYLEGQGVSVTGIETQTGVEFFLRRREGSCRRLDFGFVVGESFSEAVSPHGADWIVCLLVDRARNIACRVVPLEGKWTPLEALPDDWKVASLVAPAPQAKCFVAVVSRLRPDGKSPPEILHVEYAIARVGRESSDFKILEENIDLRFRVG